MQTSGHNNIPLSGFPIVERSDPDALAAFAKTAFRPLKVQPIAGGCRNRIHCAGSDDFSLSYGSFECGLELDVGEQQSFYKVVLGLSGVSDLHQHDEQVSVTPGVAVVKSATRPIEWRHGARAEALYLKVSREELELQLASISGRSVADPIEFAPVVVAQPLVRLLRFLVAEFDQSPSLALQPMLMTSYRELAMRTLLANQPNNYSSWLTDQVKDVAPKQLRLAEEILDAYADQPLAMADVARAAGYSLRSMNRAFRRYRGCTPHEFLQTLRFRRARKMLSTLGGAQSVTDAAMSCGFGNLGRFSVLYRRRFGECPSATFKRHNQP